MSPSTTDGDDDDELGYCNSCGEEADLLGECCVDGEVVPYGSEM